MSLNVHLIRRPGATGEPGLWGQTDGLWALALPQFLLTLGDSFHLWGSWCLHAYMGTMGISSPACCVLTPSSFFTIPGIKPTPNSEAKNNGTTKITKVLGNSKWDSAWRH